MILSDVIDTAVDFNRLLDIEFPEILVTDVILFWENGCFDMLLCVCRKRISNSDSKEPNVFFQSD
jgi:hypothetical protein